MTACLADLHATQNSCNTSSSGTPFWPWTSDFLDVHIPTKYPVVGMLSISLSGWASWILQPIIYIGLISTLWSSAKPGTNQRKTAQHTPGLPYKSSARPGVSSAVRTPLNPNATVSPIGDPYHAPQDPWSTLISPTLGQRSYLRFHWETDSPEIGTFLFSLLFGCELLHPSNHHFPLSGKKGGPVPLRLISVSPSRPPCPSKGFTQLIIPSFL